MDAALDAIITIDDDGRIVEFNLVAERTFGRARDAVRGVRLADLIIPPRFREAHLSGLKRYLATGVSAVLGTRIEVAALRADGTEFPVELAITRVPDSEPPLFTGFLRDLTDQRRAERRRHAYYRVAEILAASDSIRASAVRLLEALSQAFDAAFATLWIVDGEILRCLEAYQTAPAEGHAFAALSRRMTFVRGVGLPGRVWQTGTPHWIEDVLGDDNFPRNEAARQQGLHAACGFPVHLEGDVLAVIELFSNRVLEQDDDALKLVLSIGTQVGQFMGRKRAEEERARLLVQEHGARVDAEQANAAKDEFLAMVSHELRTPINSMLGWTSLLKSGALNDEKRLRAIDAIERSAHAQVRLVEDLLDVSRIVRGIVTLTCASIDAAAATQAAIETVQPTAQERGILIVTDGLGQRVPLWADPERLQQIIWNLLSNAVKFTPRGGTVTVRLASAGGRVQLIIEDTGIGIRAEFLPHLFERFRQGDTDVARSRGGLGLGLAIVRHLVKLHGGSVTAESEGEGKGSRFTVTLPSAPQTR